MFDKRAQIGRLTALFVLIVFGLIYFAGMAGPVGEMVCDTVQPNADLVGFEKFTYCNFNLFVFIIWLVVIVGVGALG